MLKLTSMKNIPFPFVLLPFFLAFFPANQEAGTWKVFQTQNTVTGRSECGFAAAGGKLYLIGGDGLAMTVEELDPLTKTWSKKSVMT